MQCFKSHSVERLRGSVVLHIAPSFRPSTPTRRLMARAKEADLSGTLVFLMQAEDWTVVPSNGDRWGNRSKESVAKCKSNRRYKATVTRLHLLRQLRRVFEYQPILPVLDQLVQTR
jgi:hypothetical protein